MVRHLTLLCLLISTLALAPEAEVARLRAEFQPGSIFHGEEARCDFVLYVRGPSVEVEVVKFPEFRGYWKENLVLRQGVIPLPFGLYGSDSWNKIVIGSYRLLPMVSESDLEISPMKLLVRLPGSGISPAGETMLLSDLGQGLKVKKLPPIPAGFVGPRHTGAVGRFTVVTETTVTNFTPGEPTLFRVSVHGFGNFEDVQELSLSWPDSVHILSRRTIVQGASPYQVKVFEILARINESADLELPGPALTFFDPGRARYETAQGRTIQLVHKPKPAPPPTKATDLPPIEMRWSEAPDLAHSWLFWMPQILLLLAGLSLCARRYVLERGLRLARDPMRLLRERAASARTALAAGKTDEFLAEASALALESLQKRAKIPHAGLRTRRTLELAAAALGETAVGPARLILNAHEAHSYHPSRELPSTPEALLAALDELMKAS